MLIFGKKVRSSTTVLRAKRGGVARRDKMSFFHDPEVMQFLWSAPSTLSHNSNFLCKMATEYESILCVKNEVFVYKIPPRPSNRGYRAADWKLDQHDWKGRLRVVAKGNDCIIKLEDKTSGELFAKCPVDAYPGIAVEAVMDSSRYFVIRLMDENGRTAFIGIGFADRGDSFDFNVALQDHFKWVKQSKKFEEEEKKAAVDPGPKLDLSLKEGQTIKINIGSKKSSTGVARPKPTGQVGFLPPPPGSKIPTLTPPPGQAGQTQPQQPAQQASHNLFGGTTPQSTQQFNQDLLVDFGSSSLSSSSSSSVTAPSSQQNSDWDIFGDFTAAAPPQPQQQPSSTGGACDWGDFTSAGNQDSKNSGWVQF